MTDKATRAYLGIGTIILATAGTGLTLFNNIDLSTKEKAIRSLPLAMALACAFTASEFGFLWLHKVFDHARKRWRKIVCCVAMVCLALAMGAAFFQELFFVFEKQKGEVTSNYVGKLLEQTKDTRNQRLLIRQNKIQVETPDVLAFVICYIFAALSYVTATVCTEKKRRRIGYGAIPMTPEIQSAIERKYAGFVDPINTKLYRDNRDTGYAIRNKVTGKHAGFVSDREINQ